MTFDAFLNLVPKLNNIALIGQAIQLKMAPPMRETLINRFKSTTKSKRAGVMALFFPGEMNEARLVLILRKTYKGVHSGQVGFPGGKYEKSDLNLEQTALRETEEEIGVLASGIKVFKPLTELFIPPSNFVVYPFMGYITHVPTFKKQDSEVELVIDVALSEFLSDQSVVKAEVSAGYKNNMTVPAFKLQNHIVWGATAMMLSELKWVLQQAIKLS